MKTILWAVLALAIGCQSPKAEPTVPTPTVPTPAVPQQAETAPATKVAPSSAKKVRPKKKQAQKTVKFDGPIAWTTWETGLIQAKKSRRGIMVVLYADWCVRCRELAPLWKDAGVVKAAEGLVMVHQNVDERPSWLEDLSSLGSYVPRIFFFDPDGSLREDIASEHSRYPYFYTPHSIELLKTNMKTASTY